MYKNSKAINKYNFAFLLLSLLFFSSCSKSLTPFTERLYDEFDWTDSELEKIQFYLSEDIVLKRVRANDKAKIDDGKIRVQDNKEVEQIVFEKGTPGVFVNSSKKNRIAVSFENRSGAFLMFGPNKKADGKYALLAKDWERSYGVISYNGVDYRTDSSSAYSILMVDIQKARNVKYKKKTVGGREVSR